MESYNAGQDINPNEILDLNVGGTTGIMVKRSVLTKEKDTILEAWFSGRHPIDTVGGRIFVDRDPIAFNMLISYLRNDKQIDFQNECQKKLFQRELKHWGFGQSEDPQFFDFMGIKVFNPNKKYQIILANPDGNMDQSQENEYSVSLHHQYDKDYRDGQAAFAFVRKNREHQNWRFERQERFMNGGEFRGYGFYKIVLENDVSGPKQGNYKNHHLGSHKYHQTDKRDETTTYVSGFRHSSNFVYWEFVQMEDSTFQIKIHGFYNTSQWNYPIDGFFLTAEKKYEKDIRDEESYYLSVTNKDTSRWIIRAVDDI